MSEQQRFLCWRQIAPDVTLRFEWWGGAYIDVARGDEHPSEVINVWDDYHDRPRIARTQTAFEAKCSDWIDSYTDGRGAEALAHDARSNW